MVGALILAASSVFGAPPAAPPPALPDAKDVATSEPASDPELAGQAVAVVKEALERRLLSASMRARFSEHVLPALESGCVLVLRVEPSQIPGSAAVYDDEQDAIKMPLVDMKDARSKGILLHELVHVGQDAAKLGQMREDAEHEAYEAEKEYELRSDGTLAEGDDGVVAIRAGDLGSVKSSMGRLLVYRYALKNIQAGKAELNGFEESGVDFKGDDSKDAVEYLTDNSKTAEELARGEWATATRISFLAGGGVSDTKQFLQRNGLRRCSGPPVSSP